MARDSTFSFERARLHVARATWLWLSLHMVGCPTPRERRAVARPIQQASQSTSGPCRTLALAYCKLMAECQPEAMHVELGNSAACVERWSSACTRAMALPGSGFSAGAARACATGIEQHTCGTFRRFEDLLVSACHPPGQLENGSACLDDAQCGSTFCSRPPGRDASGCGVCAARAPSQGRCWNGVPGSIRQGCPMGALCSRGYCLGPMRNEGEACGAAGAWTSNCYGDSPVDRFPFGLGCGEPRSEPNSMGTCTRAKPVQKCPEGFECEGLYSFCEQGTCQPRRLVEAGKRCDQKRDLCLAGKCQEELCHPDPVAGDRCDHETECSFPFVCANGSCALFDPACRGAARQ